MKELECPYCGMDNKVPDDCTEPNYEYECECEGCEKVFGFELEYWPSYTEYKLPCANGDEHKWQQAHGFPGWYFTNKRTCEYCGEEKELTWDDEGYIEVIKDGM